MSAEIVVPTLGESVKEATVAQWLKQVGDRVEQDEPVVELETDKVTLEVNASKAGVLTEIKVDTGGNVGVGAVLGLIDEKATANTNSKKKEAPAPAKAAAPVAPVKAASAPAPAPAAKTAAPAAADMPLAPAVRKLIEEHGLDPRQIRASGKDGRLMKSDVLDFIERGKKPASAPASAPRQAAPSAPAAPRNNAAREERVRMTRLRQRIAERLKEAQNTAAMLTTFNEIDMKACMELRAHYKESFEKKYGVRLGFMSFFVKAAIHALQEIPAINAEIDGQEIVYKNYYDIGVAVSTPNGLVVPVLREADKLTFAEIEGRIGDMGQRARDGQLAIDELTGGTFTITNGGVFGSLMSTPILNPPQSGILGMHKIQERPVVIDGKVEVRPMMYIALSYDHRIVDGREAVTFLVRIKEAIEDPQRLLLEV